MCVCVCVCFKARRFHILAPIATKLHKCTKDFPGKVVKAMPISYTYRKGPIGRPLFVAAMASCATAENDCLAKHKLGTPLRARTENHL